jgi:hypothetical protein
MMSRRGALIGGGGLALAGSAAAYALARSMGTMHDYDTSVAAARSALAAAPELAEMVRYATLAPSGHNTQPWQFRRARGRVEILPDVARRTLIVDPDDHHLFVSLGAAAETLALAFAASGRAGEIGFDPAGSGAAVFSPGSRTGTDRALFDAVPKRQSTRNEYDGRPVAPADLRALAAAAAAPGVELTLLTDRPRIARVRDLVVTGNAAQMNDKAFMRELKSWLRFSPRRAMRSGDGLFTATTANPVLPDALGPLFFDWFIDADAEGQKYARQIDSSSGLAIFCADRADPEHWILAGRACQRFALQATALGLSLAFVNQPVEVPAMRPLLAGIIGAPGRRPDLVMRFGRSPALPFSARRPVASVILP